MPKGVYKRTEDHLIQYRKNQSKAVEARKTKAAEGAQDLIGRRFGRLLALCPERINGKCFYLCICDCGKYKLGYRHSLLKAWLKSCGCLNREMCSERAKRLELWRKCSPFVKGHKPFFEGSGNPFGRAVKFFKEKGDKETWLQIRELKRTAKAIRSVVRGQLKA